MMVLRVEDDFIKYLGTTVENYLDLGLSNLLRCSPSGLTSNQPQSLGQQILDMSLAFKAPQDP